MFNPLIVGIMILALWFVDRSLNMNNAETKVAVA